MSTVSRTIRSSPYRDSSETWNLIVDLLTQGKNDERKRELHAVRGIAASLIADHTPQTAPIVITCDGPRTRIYCVFDDDALDDGDANEATLGFDPLAGNWEVSLPCEKEELSWVQAALKKHSSRITARDLSTGFSTTEDKDASAETLTLDLAGFLKP